MSIDHKTGGPAFPFKVLLNNGDGTETEHIFSGMTLRDYFAAKAMQGMLASNRLSDPVLPDVLAFDSYAIADSMLEARKR